MIHNFVCTCDACPEQYDVFSDGKYVAYVRYRHGSLTVNPVFDGVVDWDTYIMSEELGESDGIMSWEGSIPERIHDTVMECIDEAITKYWSKPYRNIDGEYLYLDDNKEVVFDKGEGKWTIIDIRKNSLLVRRGLRFEVVYLKNLDGYTIGDEIELKEPVEYKEIESPVLEGFNITGPCKPLKIRQVVSRNILNPNTGEAHLIPYDFGDFKNTYIILHAEGKNITFNNKPINVEDEKLVVEEEGILKIDDCEGVFVGFPCDDIVEDEYEESVMEMPMMFPLDQLREGETFEINPKENKVELHLHKHSREEFEELKKRLIDEFRNYKNVIITNE